MSVAAAVAILRSLLAAGWRVADIVATEDGSGVAWLFVGPDGQTVTATVAGGRIDLDGGAS